LGDVRADEAMLTGVRLVGAAWSLDRFLRDGTKAAQSAASLFTELDAVGVAVGNTVFTRDNENTMRGERLANEFRASLEGTRFHSIVEEASSMQALVKRLIREMKHEQPRLG
jgi:hypothetical protein